MHMYAILKYSTGSCLTLDLPQDLEQDRNREIKKTDRQTCERADNLTVLRRATFRGNDEKILSKRLNT